MIDGDRSDVQGLERVDRPVGGTQAADQGELPDAAEMRHRLAHRLQFPVGDLVMAALDRAEDLAGDEIEAEEAA